jgi:hypothetical protein
MVNIGVGSWLSCTFNGWRAFYCLNLSSGRIWSWQVAALFGFAGL